MTIFTEITLLLIIATLIAFLMRVMRQPLIIGYIITGLLVGPFAMDLLHSESTLQVFSEIGIALLLFIVGLKLTPKTIKTFGKVSAVTGFGQIIFTVAIGWLLGLAFGFSQTASIYLGVALAFSSTIIVLKLLSDKGDLEKLYGRISVGFLLVQDFVAVLILFLIPMITPQGFSEVRVFLQVVLGLIILGGVYLATYYIFPYLQKAAARSQELLFLFALAWGLGLAALMRGVGFSLESGALIAGISLSTLPSHEEIHSRLKPLRDFFIIVFFVLLGAEMALGGTASIIIPALVLSIVVLIIKPIILMTIMGYLGYRKKTSFATGLSIAQISEFSLIIAALGLKMGHINNEIVSLITLVGIFTIFGSTYLVKYSEFLYEFFSPVLSLFEREVLNHKKVETVQPELVLFGHNRIGFDFLETFKKFKLPFLVVDYDPDVIEMLAEKKINTEYGDAGDVDFLRSMNLTKTKMVVSTIPDYDTNTLILDEARRQNEDAIAVAVAHSIEESLSLYEKGVNYVIMPHFLGGHAASQIIEKHEFSKAGLQKVRRKHIRYLKKRQEYGHEHPSSIKD